MSQEKIVTDLPDNQDNNESSNITEESAINRRDFLVKTMAVASGLAITAMVPAFVSDAWTEVAAAAAPCPPGQPLQKIMEITRNDTTKTLKAVLKILDSNKTWLVPGCDKNSGPMRYMSGYDASVDPSKRVVWPTNTAVPNPGPTLRVRLGDTVQITLLNQVNVKNFPGTLDMAEQGQACDQNTTQGVGNTYPGNPSFEYPPNCFHGSSSTNLHFHGTHVSPSGVSDNVLLNIRPSPIVNGRPVIDESTVAAIFAQVFTNCMSGKQPAVWSDWPQAWQDMQKKYLIEYDNTTPWQGQAAKPGQPALPHDEMLWPQNEDAIAKHELPQYYVGAYPTCFTTPVYNPATPTNPVMGQAPGTHWYHAHKHGSTALNLANGMAGALIIEGDYDDVLRPFYTQQHVLVLQQYSAVPYLLRTAQTTPTNGPPPDLVVVNGQYTPVIQMRPNEMQFWRFINATHSAQVPLDSPTGIKWVQTAQDGIQFAPANYNPAVTNASFKVPASATAPFGSLAAGNRIDVLVQAPSTTGTFRVTFNGGVLLLTVNVSGTPTNPMPFPTQQQFPALPAFLADINPGDPKIVKRDLYFLSGPPTTGTPPVPYPSPSPYYKVPQKHMINGEQFSGDVDQTMTLGEVGLWTLHNQDPTNAAHPFHIHINPFQVIEIMDPKQNNGQPVQLPRPWVWWDNFAIPPGGYVKITSRFVDFTGKYVLHCHLLDHEDRGMMQLVQVVPSATTMKHK